MADEYGRVWTHTLHFFPMTSPFGICEQLVVYDPRITGFRVVQVDDDKWMHEENGHRYHREHSPYTMWAPIHTSNVQYVAHMTIGEVS